MSSSCAVVVSYNRIELLRECITALRQQVRKLDGIIVVDNGSTDGSREFLATLADELHIIMSSENGGGAGGFSQGLDKAISLGYDYAWLMDDDARAHLDAHYELQDFIAAHPGLDFSFLASSVVDVRDAVIGSHTAGLVDPDLSTNGSTLARLTHCSFVGAYISIAYARKTWLPIADFFIYHDDAEYTSRLTRHAPGYLVPSSRITHPDKTGSGDFGPRALYDLRNRIWIKRDPRLAGGEVRKNLTGGLGRRFLMSAKVARSKRTFAKAALRALRDGLMRHARLNKPSLVRDGEILK